ncbi:hypothetical protein CIB48_g11546 [Xylaria polymorpha]|nr:hypothetical protein CIB48_g11546 [Xylaria polymorpha]
MSLNNNKNNLRTEGKRTDSMSNQTNAVGQSPTKAQSPTKTSKENLIDTKTSVENKTTMGDSVTNTDPVTSTTSDAVKTTETTTESTPNPKVTPNPTRASKMEALKKKAEESKAKAAADAMSRMSLFDSTQASGWKVTGTSALGAMKVDNNSIIVSGRNIGAEQMEPEWTMEQMAEINKAVSTTLKVMPVMDTRRSVMDPKQEFVGRDSNGSIVPTELAYVSTLTPEHYCIGTGPEKFDTTGSPRYYADVVVADINGNWLVNQWTSEGVVIEGVAQNILMQTNRVGNTSGRRIGHHFARIGLPKFAFGPLFTTLNTNFGGTLSQISQTNGYYWMNASWGVSSFAATFSYMDETGLRKVSSLVDVMRMLNGKSSLCLGTIAISVTCPAKMTDGKPTPDKTSFGLSIKMHNAFHIDTVDYHGPPQQGSTGMMVPARIAQKAKLMTSGGIGTMGGVSNIFGTTGRGIFTQTNTNTPPPTSTTANSQQTETGRWRAPTSSKLHSKNTDTTRSIIMDNRPFIIRRVAKPGSSINKAPMVIKCEWTELKTENVYTQTCRAEDLTAISGCNIHPGCKGHYMRDMNNTAYLIPFGFASGGVRRSNNGIVSSILSKHNIGKPYVQMRNTMMLGTLVSRDSKFIRTKTGIPHPIPAIVADKTMTYADCSSGLTKMTQELYQTEIDAAKHGKSATRTKAVETILKNTADCYSYTDSGGVPTIDLIPVTSAMSRTYPYTNLSYLSSATSPQDLLKRAMMITCMVEDIDRLSLTNNERLAVSVFFAFMSRHTNIVISENMISVMRKVRADWYTSVTCSNIVWIRDELPKGLIDSTVSMSTDINSTSWGRS